MAYWTKDFTYKWYFRPANNLSYYKYKGISRCYCLILTDKQSYLILITFWKWTKQNWRSFKRENVILLRWKLNSDMLNTRNFKNSRSFIYNYYFCFDTEADAILLKNESRHNILIFNYWINKSLYLFSYINNCTLKEVILLTIQIIL